uniref:Uncharacterized protein n=1 Tax=Picea glauca TaxID=3330 RepID=A0A101M3B3_PICGL|nr:hypothetical protein ABT39_MTgene3340 [Picea glauca]QHR89102.1 hypothetical protein Q903MT_gene3121 [Picea sitchensis]
MKLLPLCFLTRAYCLPGTRPSGPALLCLVLARVLQGYSSRPLGLDLPLWTNKYGVLNYSL